MAASPCAWSRAILRFSAMPFFHAFEITSRLVLGALLLGFADQTLHPRALSAAGALLVAVGFGLLLLGGARHRAFAVRSAGFVGIFRAGGLVALACGAFVVYSALAPALAGA